MAPRTGATNMPADTAPEKKTRKPQGPRKPSPLYAFVKAGEDGKIAVSASFRDPRKMADYFNTANANGEQLLVINPEA